VIAQTICGAYCRSAFCVKDLGVVLRGEDLLDELFATATVRKLPPKLNVTVGQSAGVFFVWQLDRARLVLRGPTITFI
jgi:hypothetical protein